MNLTAKNNTYQYFYYDHYPFFLVNINNYCYFYIFKLLFSLSKKKVISKMSECDGIISVKPVCVFGKEETNEKVSP